MAISLQRLDEGEPGAGAPGGRRGRGAGETMPAVPGPPGWTPHHRAAFRAFHRERYAGLDGPHRELTFAVLMDGRTVGVARLARVEAPNALEAGLWLSRRARGRGVGGEVLRLLLAEAAGAGPSLLLAETTRDNIAALRLLRAVAASVGAPDGAGHVRVELPLAP